MQQRLNIAIGGGACTGKSTLAALLFAELKERGFDYDLVTEESRKLRAEFGNCQTTFERLYLWRRQEREELRSRAADGFITDSPLFQQYASARVYSTEERDKLAVRELFRMCLDLRDRYHLIVIARNPDEIPYRDDSSRTAGSEKSKLKHHYIRTFVDHVWPEKLLLVEGSVVQRAQQVHDRLAQLRQAG